MITCRRRSLRNRKHFRKSRLGGSTRQRVELTTTFVLNFLFRSSLCTIHPFFVIWVWRELVRQVFIYCLPTKLAFIGKINCLLFVSIRYPYLPLRRLSLFRMTPTLKHSRPHRTCPAPVIKLLLVPFPLTSVIFTTSLFHSLLDGGAVLFWKTSLKTIKPWLYNLRKAISETTNRHSDSISYGFTDCWIYRGNANVCRSWRKRGFRSLSHGQFFF